jgi:hypothetical protein
MSNTKSNLDNNNVLKHLTSTLIKRKFRSTTFDLVFCILPVKSDGIVIEDFHLETLDNEYIEHSFNTIKYFFNDSIQLLLKVFKYGHHIISFGIYDRINDKFGTTYFLSNDKNESDVLNIFANIFENTIGYQPLFNPSG